jgi:uncharacterized membrane protein (DUF106 family)
MDFLQTIPVSTLFILSLAALISLLTTLVNRLLTKPEQLKQARKEVSEWNRQLREARRNNDKKALEKLMKKQKQVMQLQSKMMWQSMKVSLLFLVPLLIMWQVLGGIFGQTPIAYFPGVGWNLPIPIFSSSLLWWYLLCSMLFGTAFQHVFKMVEVTE